MGYRCSPGVTIFDYNFLDTFFRLFKVKTRTINSTRIFTLDAFNKELNSTPFHSARIFKLGFACATIELQVSFVY